MTGVRETHVSEAKKQKVKELAEQMKRKTVMIISIKSLPSAQFQDIKKKLRSKATIQVAKKSSVDFALDHCGIKELHGLVKYVDDSTALLFSDVDAFEISGILADEKSPAKAKAGQIAPSDIEVKAGPTELIPGPDISALSAVGLIPKVENGKIAVMQDKIIAKEGDEITEALASIMAKLDIIPFEVGVEPIAAYMDGRVYAGIKIDKAESLAKLEESFGRAISFSVELGIMNDSTIDFIIGRAGIEGNAIDDLIGEEKVEEIKEEVVDAPEGVPPAQIASADADKVGKEKTEDNTEEVKTSEEKE